MIRILQSKSKGRLMERNCIKVCVTGGAGFIASWLVKKLLEKGYTVHATLLSLDDELEVGLVKSLPYADTRLVLFQADIYNPSEFEAAIEGCHYVFHLATPLQHNAQSSKYKDITEAAIAGVESIADCCIRSKTVKRLVYTASVMASSPLEKDGNGYKSFFDESCWTPLNLSFTFSNDHLLAYTKSKTLAEMEVLSYNENGDEELEVVSLACGLVGGDNTLLSYLPASVAVIVSHITGDLTAYNSLRFIQELCCSIPMVHINDVCEAHIFCIEKESLRGRLLCTSAEPTVEEIANYYQENHLRLDILEKLMGGPERGSRCRSAKLVEMGFKYKYDVKKILDDSVACQSRLNALSSK